MTMAKIRSRIRSIQKWWFGHFRPAERKRDAEKGWGQAGGVDQYRSYS
jgi:hypothetical protein